MTEADAIWNAEQQSLVIGVCELSDRFAASGLNDAEKLGAMSCDSGSSWHGPSERFSVGSFVEFIVNDRKKTVMWWVDSRNLGTIYKVSCHVDVAGTYRYDVFLGEFESARAVTEILSNVIDLCMDDIMFCIQNNAVSKLIEIEFDGYPTLPSNPLRSDQNA